MPTDFPASSIAQYFQSFLRRDGFRIVDGTVLSQLVDMLFVPKTGIIAHAGGGQIQDANNVLKIGTNQIETVVTANDSVMLPRAIPGARVEVHNATANAIQIFGQPSNPVNGGAGDTIVPDNSNVPNATNMGVTHAGGTAATYVCYQAGTWKQMFSALVGGVPSAMPPSTPSSASYPVLSMPAGITAGVYPTTKPGVVNIGTGANSISFSMGTAVGSMVYTNPPQVPVEFNVNMTDENGSHTITSTLHCTGAGWQGNFAFMQSFTLNGNWGKNISKIVWQPAGLGWPDYTCVINLAINGVTMTLADGTAWSIGGGSGSANTPFVWQASAATPATPPPAQVAGDGSLPGLIAAGTLPARTIKDTAVISTNVTGAGIGQTIIDATGITLAHGKAVLVPIANVTIKNLTIMGAATAPGGGSNGAGVRDDAAYGFTLDTVEIHNCQDGVLTFDGNYTVQNCNIHDNGTGDGQTHNLYFGGNPTSTVTLTNNTSINPNGGHAVKSRAGTTNMSGNTCSASGSSVVDIPDGGVFTASNETWSKPSGSTNHVLLSFGLESANNASTGMVVTLTNVVFNVPDGNGIIGLRDGTTLNLNNVTGSVPTIQWIPGVAPGTVNGHFG